MDLFTTYTVTTGEVQAITEPPLITTAPAEPFPACRVFTNRSPGMTANSDSSASRAQVLSLQPLGQNSTDLLYD
jgi:hypothetical protein